MAKEETVISQHVDQYIDSLLKLSKKYHLEGTSQRILNYTIYLLLNSNFQLLLHSFRKGLHIPEEGFDSESSYQEWEIHFKNIVTEYHDGKKVDKQMRRLIWSIEKNLGRPLIDKWPKPPNRIVYLLCDDAIRTTSEYIYRYLNLKNTKHHLCWMSILEQLFRLDEPESIIRHLHNYFNHFGAFDMSFKSHGNMIQMSIGLYPDTTVKDIKKYIESQKDRIAKEISGIKEYSRNDKSKTDSVVRDYSIYKTYLNQGIHRKRGDNIYFNTTKSEAVKNSLQDTSNLKNIELNSIKQIVARTKKRIKQTFPNPINEIYEFLSVLSPKSRT